MQNRPNSLIKQLVVAAALAALPQVLLAHGPSVANTNADDAPPPHARVDTAPDQDACGGRPLPPEMPGPGMPPGEGPLLPPEVTKLAELPPLHRVALSEAQHDALFAIMHAQAPVQRELEKKARKALDELRRVGQSTPFNARQARALADTLAQAQAQLAYNRAEVDSKLRALLSAEQRQKLDSAGSAQDQLPPKHDKGAGQPPGKP